MVRLPLVIDSSSSSAILSIVVIAVSHLSDSVCVAAFVLLNAQQAICTLVSTSEDVNIVALKWCWLLHSFLHSFAD